MTLSLEQWTKALSSFGGRDKLALLVFSITRFNRGALKQSAVVDALGSATAAEWHRKNEGMFFALADARRVFRFLSSIPALLKLKKALEGAQPWGASNQGMYIATQALLAAWCIPDHLRYLVQMKFFGTADDKVFFHLTALRTLCVAKILMLVVAVRRYASGSASRRAVFAAALGVLTIGHAGKFPGLVTSDMTAGATGTVGAWIAIQDAWPKSKAP